MKKSSVSVIIPAYNEEIYIGKTIRALDKISLINEIIVVNDASSDRTGEIAYREKAQVLNLLFRTGKGGALNQGIKLAKGDIICLIDADVGETAAEIEKLLQPVINYEADMTVGIFPPALKKGGLGFVKGLARKGIEFFTGEKFIAPLSGQRVMRRTVIESLGPFEKGFGVEVGMSIDALRKGFRIKEVPVNMRHAETGRNLKGFFHRGKQFINILNVLARKAVIR